MKKRLTWITLGLLAALGAGVLAAPPLNLLPVYLWFGTDKVSASNPLPTTVISGSVSMTGGNETEDIAASQTDQALGAIGGVGDRFGGFICVLTATSAAAVTVEDGALTAFTLIPSGSPAGMYSLQHLDWISTNGAWEFTTGANMSCKAWGDFT